MMLFGAVLVAAPWLIRIRTEYGPAAKTSAIVLGILALIGGALAMLPSRHLALAALALPVIAIPIAAPRELNLALARQRHRVHFEVAAQAMRAYRVPEILDLLDDGIGRAIIFPVSLSRAPIPVKYGEGRNAIRAARPLRLP